MPVHAFVAGMGTVGRRTCKGMLASAASHADEAGKHADTAAAHLHGWQALQVHEAECDRRHGLRAAWLAAVGKLCNSWSLEEPCIQLSDC